MNPTHTKQSHETAQSPAEQDSQTISVREFLAKLRSSPGYADQISHIEEIPPRAAQYGTLAQPLSPPLADALARHGVRQLYSHQATAVEALRAGRHAMVVTGTASGKTLCYNIPVLEEILRHRMSRALYMFPTKALAQDQLRSLHELTAAPALRHVLFGTYDGDTPRQARPPLRRRGNILLTNPDMLHVGILPNHSSWATFFRRLRYIVLDEAHVYRGIFGSHVACVLRRLRRICALYDSHPQFILCSATVANAGEHAQRLTGESFVVVDEDGAPRGLRHFALWNSPFEDQAHGLRRSINTEATWLFTELVKAGLRNITFTRARKIAELILLYAQESLRRDRPDLVERVSAYRGGYMPAERREIEQRLFDGDLLGVTATNALELGIDVGDLDATVLVGYPGTIASTWQQAGRSGRGLDDAMSVLIAQDNPLDQFFMRHPEELFGRSHEHALIDPENPYVLRGHLPCAAYEAPLNKKDLDLFGAPAGDEAAALGAQGVLDDRNGRWYFPSDDYPAQWTNLRSSSEATFLLLDESNGNAILEQIDASSAMFRLYPGAIHLHRAEAYVITRLDVERHIAVARPADVNYYTQVRELNEVHILRSLEAKDLGATDVFFGRVRVTEQVIGFMRKARFTEEKLSEEPLDLPPTTFETQALWFEVPVHLGAQVEHRGLDFAGGLHAVEHACIGLLPLFAMCDRNDIGGVSTTSHPDTGRPQVFIYDAYAGGVGIAKKGYELIESLWERTLETVRECPCEEGCPSCIHSPKCGNNNEPLDKAAAAMILEALTAG